MVSGQRSINLFDSKASLPPSWQIVERYVYIMHRYLLGFVLLCGMILLTTYSIVRFRTTQLDLDEQRLIQTIHTLSVKEGMLLALRARISALSKILDVQFSVAPYIDTTLLLARPPQLQSFAIGEKNTVTISVELSDVNKAVSLMESIMNLVHENKIRDPNLISLKIDKDGIISLNLSYRVLLTPAL